MNEKTNTITWARRTTNDLRTVRVTHVALGHPEGEREAGCLSLTFDDGPYHYRMRLARRQDSCQFEGICERLVRESEKFVEAIPVCCSLFDSLDRDALILGITPWLNDSLQEQDWMGRFVNVERVTYHDKKDKDSKK